MTLSVQVPHTHKPTSNMQCVRCERHGGLFNMMLEKARWHDPPASEEDLRRVLREVEAAKNRLFNRSGFSPSQRMLGHTPRSNGELMSDDAIDPALLGPILPWGTSPNGVNQHSNLGRAFSELG